MSDVIELSDEDFALQMHGLIHEAERALEDRKTLKPSSTQVSMRPEKAAAAPEPAPTPAAAPEVEPAAAPKPAPAPSTAEMLRPLVQGLQAVGRASGEHTQILSRLDKAAAEAGEAHKELPKVVSELKGLMEQRNSVSRQMFDALYDELKSYKDGFLLDSVHRPMIRDLITLFDDLTLIHAQMHEPAEMLGRQPVDGFTQDLGKRLDSITLHIEHNLEFIVEVLARLEVTLLPFGKGKLDKQTQRAVALEAAEDPDDDLMVVRTVKRGFLWKDRVVRAEEVVIKKWKEGFLMALKSSED